MIGATALPAHSPYFDILMYGAAAAIVVSLIGLAVLFLWQPKKEAAVSDDTTDEAGDDNTVIGTPPKRMGSRNTIVNFSDANGNTLLNRPGTSIGAGAGFDPTSVIIGAGAGANIGKKPKGEEGR